ncbi:hypothetical protein AMATHDRAFT_54727 [Amanita thiersii Skay4041]|uniref:Kinase n=1 Tax=Amanita thiersii Skay4041 TaxID=703135 RepID=A0A2A9NYH3_9AGAR|nr:hypothetical protein AMATHDRAFT_54727 [Amanita thiersii Skay4041]
MSEPTVTRALKSQVGGHKGVTTTEDESLIIKPALPLEVNFYQTLNSESTFAPLRPFVPNFIGTLKLEGEIAGNSANGGSVVIQTTSNKKESIVLENLSHPFLKPNILDIKLGTVLYDEDAPLDKKERMIKTAQQTTSFETGIRLTGFQVYDNETQQPVITPKSYGKSIKSSDLPDGIARFFPVGSGHTTSSSSGLPLKLLLPILSGVRDDVAEIREVMAALELRMVAGSLLVIYEADWARAEEMLKCGYVVEEEEEEEDEEESDEDEKKKNGPPFVVKLIDFAHTRVATGEGPDEGVLKGIDTVLRLIDGRIRELE